MTSTEIPFVSYTLEWTGRHLFAPKDSQPSTETFMSLDCNPKTLSRVRHRMRKEAPLWARVSAFCVKDLEGELKQPGFRQPVISDAREHLYHGLPIPDIQFREATVAAELSIGLQATPWKRPDSVPFSDHTMATMAEHTVFNRLLPLYARRCNKELTEKFWNQYASYERVLNLEHLAIDDTNSSNMLLMCHPKTAAKLREKLDYVGLPILNQHLPENVLVHGDFSAIAVICNPINITITREENTQYTLSASGRFIAYIWDGTLGRPSAVQISETATN